MRLVDAPNLDIVSNLFSFPLRWICRQLLVQQKLTAKKVIVECPWIFNTPRELEWPAECERQKDVEFFGAAHRHHWTWNTAMNRRKWPEISRKSFLATRFVQNRGRKTKIAQRSFLCNILLERGSSTCSWIQPSGHIFLTFACILDVSGISMWSHSIVLDFSGGAARENNYLHLIGKRRRDVYILTSLSSNLATSLRMSARPANNKLLCFSDYRV